MQRAHKIRLNPTPEQQAYFRKAVGTARFVYNWGLVEVKRALDDGHTPDSPHDLKARFNALKREQFPWVYEVTKCVVEGAFRNLAAALANFRASKRGVRLGKRMGFPKYKRKKRGAGSFYLANDKFTLDGHWISIPKLGQVNMTESLRFSGKIMSATISERAGWWWVSIQVEVPREQRQHQGQALGVDVGVKELAVCSDGERFENQKPLFPSSRLHNGCGGYKADLDLTERVWTCPACGRQVDRDLNAARNIRDEALRVSAVPGVATSAR